MANAREATSVPWMKSLRVGCLGLGEAGGAIAKDLVDLGVDVCAWDPRPVNAPAGVRIVDVPGAVADAELVLSANSADAAVAAAESVVPFLTAPTVYADLNSGGASLKRKLNELIAPTGALFADVALMATVPGNGLRTPAFAAGPGAVRIAEQLSALGMPIAAIGVEPGAAAMRKLLRSVFMKGLASCAIEALRAADAAGCRDWLWSDLSQTLTNADEAVLERLVRGSELHATRRAHEMSDASALLRELGVAPHMTDAATRSLRKMATEEFS
jgi:3-hydroxyisobutyrate dehydrogenase-like beta-hydroxyacid dehydrogenase